MRVSKVISLLLGIIVAGSTRAAAGQHIVYVPSPSGGDDTAAIQQALDTCVQQHPTGCTVQLAAGIYHTRQLVAYNFHGTLKGLGMDTTTIEAEAGAQYMSALQNARQAAARQGGNAMILADDAEFRKKINGRQTLVRRTIFWVVHLK